MLTEMEELPVIKLGDYTLQLELGPLSEFGKEVAERELRETPEKQKEAVKELRELMKGNSFTIKNIITTKCLSFSIYIM